MYFSLAKLFLLKVPYTFMHYFVVFSIEWVELIHKKSKGTSDELKVDRHTLLKEEVLTLVC